MSNPVCTICEDEILPDEPSIRGTKEGIMFHDDCYLRAQGIPEELIDNLAVSQDSAGRVLTTLNLDPNLKDEE